MRTLTKSCWNRRKQKQLTNYCLTHKPHGVIIYCLFSEYRTGTAVVTASDTHTPALIKTIYYNCIIILITQMNVLSSVGGGSGGGRESMRIYGMEFHFHTHTRKPDHNESHRIKVSCDTIHFSRFKTVAIKRLHLDALNRSVSTNQTKKSDLSSIRNDTQPTPRCNSAWHRPIEKSPRSV